MKTFNVFNLSGSFSRPATTGTTYSSGDLVANSATAGSVVPISLVSKLAAGTYIIRRVRLRKSGTTITNASFRIHFYRTASITFANGDNGAWSTNQVANYLGAFDVTVDKVFTDGAAGNGAPLVGSEIAVRLDPGDTLAAVIEVRGAFGDVSGETFTVTAELLQY